MSFMDKAQTLLRRFRTNGQPDDESMYSRRHDGSLSGYHPNSVRQPQTPEQEQPAPVDVHFDAYNPPQPYAQDPAMEQPAESSYTFQQSYQQPVQPVWSQPEQPYAQPDYSTGYQPQFQAPPGNVNQPGSPFYGYQPQFPQQPAQPMQPAQPQQPVPDNISYFPGGVIGEDRREYLHTVRIAQIAGVPDCYALMQNMRNSETVVINLDMVQDSTEIDRCLDLLFGAAYALQCQFNSIASRNVYLLTPGTIQVLNTENLRRRSEYEMDNRWPDPNNLAYRQRVAGREQPPVYAPQGSYASPYQNHGGMGRYTGVRSTGTEYTDFGGFPSASRF